MKTIVIWAALAVSTAVPAQDAAPVMLVLDASGSMWGQIGGRSKVEIARDAVGTLVQGWNASVPLGLVAYGHRHKGECSDIETLIAPGPLDRAAFAGTVNRLNAKGMTPLSAAVIDAAKALRSSEQKATVILVSDGEETCNLDPCQVGRELEAAGVDFTAHVIGFDVPNPQHQAQLRCLAETTGGRYFNARNADDLAGTLSTLAKVSSEPPLPPAQARLDAPDRVSATSDVEVAFEGPGDEGDYLSISVPDDRSGHYDYAPASAGSPVTLPTPAVPGRYELRYVSPRRETAVLATRPLEVTAVSGEIDAPASVVAGSEVVVHARGPVSERHWIGFAPAGSADSAFLDYRRPTGAESELTLRVPTETGRYELRYVLNEYEQVLVRRPIEVTPASASLRAPSSTAAGSTIEIEVVGPAGNGTWVGFAPAGSDADSYLDYRDLAAGQQQYTLDAPTTPGRYELRVVMTDPSTVLAAQPIEVTAVQATLQGPASAAAGSRVEVEADGPSASGSWVGFAPVGSDEHAYVTYRYIEAGTTRYTIEAPEEPGEYELRYVLGESTVIARRPITIE